MHHAVRLLRLDILTKIFEQRKVEVAHICGPESSVEEKQKESRNTRHRKIHGMDSDVVL